MVEAGLDVTAKLQPWVINTNTFLLIITHRVGFPNSFGAWKKHGSNSSPMRVKTPAFQWCTYISIFVALVVIGSCCIFSYLDPGVVSTKLRKFVYPESAFERQENQVDTGEYCPDLPFRFLFVLFSRFSFPINNRGGNSCAFAWSISFNPARIYCVTTAVFQAGRGSGDFPPFSRKILCMWTH